MDISHSSMQMVELYCDNMSSIRLASNPVFHARTKHIEMHYHFIWEKVLQEEIDLIQMNNLLIYLRRHCLRGNLSLLENSSWFLKFAQRGSVEYCANFLKFLKVLRR